MKLAQILGIAAALLLTGCSGKPVVWDYQPGTDFSQVHSYAFHAQPDTGSEGRSLTDERVRNAVSLVMRSKGFALVEQGAADVLTGWRIKQETELRREGFSYGIGYGVLSGNTGVGISMSTRPPATEVVRGKLVLEMIDPQTSRVIWSAESTQPLSEDETPSAREAEIRRIVAEMLQNFPPTS